MARLFAARVVFDERFDGLSLAPLFCQRSRCSIGVCGMPQDAFAMLRLAAISHRWLAAETLQTKDFFVEFAAVKSYRRCFENVKLLNGQSDTFGMSVKPSQLDLLSRLLDVTALRQQVIGQNVANVNTPGYRQQELRFEESLKALIEGNRLSELPELDAEIATTEGLPERSDGNNVDIDLEMSKLNKNALLYETYTQILSVQLGMVRSAISGQA